MGGAERRGGRRRDRRKRVALVSRAIRFRRSRLRPHVGRLRRPTHRRDRRSPASAALILGVLVTLWLFDLCAFSVALWLCGGRA